MSLVKLEIELVDFSEVFESAIGLAFSQDITVYDASYLAVSQTRHIPLVTADYKTSLALSGGSFVIPLLQPNWCQFHQGSLHHALCGIRGKDQAPL